MKSRIRLWTSQAGDPPDEESGHELLLSEAKPSLTAHSFQFSSGSAGCPGGALSFGTFLWASKEKYIPRDALSFGTFLWASKEKYTIACI